MLDLMKNRNRNDRTGHGYGMKKRFATLMMAFLVSCSAVFCSACIQPEENIIETQAATKEFSLQDVPKYSGEASVTVNNNKPYFTAREKKNTKTFESYHKLDKLGRCGVAYANVCPELMPTEERGAIGSVKPSGWHTVKYNGIVDGNYLYNRCHLIAYCLTAENANKKNLITGTRYMNTEGMLPYETKVAQYVEQSGNHVLYRVTPVFEGDNLVAGGVLMEAYSVEDSGKGISFCVYCYNVQPQITIDYKTGDSKLSKSSGDSGKKDNTSKSNGSSKDSDSAVQKQNYVLNTNTKKFHKPGCASVKRMSAKNKKKVHDTRKNLIHQGYDPCKNCNP